MDYREYLESRSDVMLGKPVIKGTRLTAELILQMLSEGASAEDVIAAYPHLKPVHISAVLAYASDVISNESLISAA